MSILLISYFLISAMAIYCLKKRIFCITHRKLRCSYDHNVINNKSLNFISSESIKLYSVHISFKCENCKLYTYTYFYCISLYISFTVSVVLWFCEKKNRFLVTYQFYWFMSNNHSLINYIDNVTYNYILNG